MMRSARFALLTMSVTASGGPQAVEPLGREVGSGNGEQSCCTIAVVTSKASRQQCLTMVPHLEAEEGPHKVRTRSLGDPWAASD